MGMAEALNKWPQSDVQRDGKNRNRRGEMANNFAAQSPQPLFSLVAARGKGCNGRWGTLWEGHKVEVLCLVSNLSKQQ